MASLFLQFHTLSILVTVLQLQYGINASSPSKSEYETLQVPTISVSEFLNGNESVKQSIANKLDVAMKRNGFFYLDINNLPNHMHTNIDLLSSIYQSSSSFFNQPLEYKLLYSGDTRAASGYQSAAAERAAFDELNTDHNTNEHCQCPDLNENFRWRPLDNNQTLPTEFAQNNILSAYTNYLTDSILPILHNIASMALNISDINYFANNIYNRKPWGIAMRINHYYKLPEDDKSCGDRLGAHCDYVGFALLLTDNVSGLQGMDKDGIWYNILSPDKPNVFVVNAGEMIERGTNGYWMAAKHRVIRNTNERRISIALFTGPNTNELIKPFDHCDICRREPYKYGEIITIEQHVMNRLNALSLEDVDTNNPS